jgi:flagellar biosynthetic protein FlhB
MAEKSEAPTGRRMQEARDRGQVLHSIEFNAAFGLLGGTWLIQGPGAQLVQSLNTMFIEAFSGIQAYEVSELWLIHLLSKEIGAVLLPLGQIVLGLMVIGLVVTFAQTGLSFSDKRKLFDFSRVNPISGFKRLFSSDGLFNLLKALIKLLVVGWVAYSFLRVNMEKMLALGQLDLRSGVSDWVSLAIAMMWRVGIAYLILAIIDYIYQRWQFYKNLRMTKEEVKEEYKSSEGDPAIKGRIRQQQQQMARRRMMSAVPKADVIITNPTHYAVAVKYDSHSMQAPRVLAKGTLLVAQRIVDIARNHTIPVVQNIPLARTLYAAVDIDQEIPSELYMAMAEVLAYVYRLRDRKFQTASA